jgi:tetratricopeptide (TPR) repeat protein
MAAIAIAGPLAAIKAQDNAQAVPADVNAAIRAAQSQNNYEILEDAAQAAERQRKYDTAKQLLEPAVALRAESKGQQSIEYGIGLLKLGDLESKRNQNKSAEDFYSRAAQILGDRPEAARALIYLGKTAIQRKDYSEAVDYLQRAQNDNAEQAGVALMWMAVARSSEGNDTEADALFQTALARQEPNSPGAVTTLEVYARFLRKQGSDEKAKELEARATDTQKVIAVTRHSAPMFTRSAPGSPRPRR